MAFENAGNFRPFDLGQTLSAAENINNARLQNSRLSNLLETQPQRLEQERQLNDLNIRSGNQELDGLIQRNSLEDMATDAVRAHSMLSSGDVEGTRNLALQRRQKLLQRQQTDPSVDTVQTDRFLSVLDQNPEAALKMLTADVKGFREAGILGTPKDGAANFSPKTEVLRNGVVIQSRGDGGVDVRNQAGQLVFGEERERLIKEGRLKSPEEVAQIEEITRLKNEAKKNTTEEKLKLQKLQKEIDEKNLKVEEGEKQKEKAGQLQTTALRLIDDLLKDPDAVRSIVGPADSSFLSPTLLPSSLRAQTKINQLKSIMTAENLGIMTGVLSETDIKIIAQIAGGGLDVGGDDEAFIEELQRMRGSLSGAVAPSAGPQEGATATNPQTGQKAIFRNGQWQPM